MQELFVSIGLNSILWIPNGRSHSPTSRWHEFFFAKPRNLKSSTAVIAILEGNARPRRENSVTRRNIFVVT